MSEKNLKDSPRLAESGLKPEAAVSLEAAAFIARVAWEDDNSGLDKRLRPKRTRRPTLHLAQRKLGHGHG